MDLKKVVMFLVVSNIGYSQLVITEDNTNLKIVNDIYAKKTIGKDVLVDPVGDVEGFAVSGNGVLVIRGINGTNIENNSNIIGGLFGENLKKSITMRDQGIGIFSLDSSMKLENNGKIVADTKLLGGNIEANINEEKESNTSVFVLPKLKEGRMTRAYSLSNGIYGNLEKNTGLVLGNVFIKDKNIDANISASAKIAEDAKRQTLYAAPDLVQNSEIQLFNSANGVKGKVEENEGIIEGNSNITGGEIKILSQAKGEASKDCRIDVFSRIDLNNNISLYDSFNGIYNENSQTINRGTVSGKASIIGGNINATVKGEGTGLGLVSAGIKNALSGIRLVSSGNGVYNTSENSEMFNNGIISGEAKLTGGKINSFFNTIYNSAEPIKYGYDNRAESSVYLDLGIVGDNVGNGVSKGLIKNNDGMILGNTDIGSGEINLNSRISATTDSDIKENIRAEVSDNESIIINLLNSGNGIYNGKIENNSGIISGKNIARGKKIGLDLDIVSEDIIGEAINIYGNISTKKTGNGVYGDIGENNGNISGENEIYGGMSEPGVTRNIKVNHAIRIIENNVLSKESGNGVYGETLDKNKGIISGNLKLIGGKSILSEYFASFSEAKVESFDSGNGVYGDVKENLGIISGKAEIYGGKSQGAEDLNLFRTESKIDIQNSGNGVYGESLDDNKGIIKGDLFRKLGEKIINNSDGTKTITPSEENIEFSGNGLAFNGTILNIKNTGVIIGRENAIAASEINNLKNYGIMAGKNIYKNKPINGEEHGVHILLKENGEILSINNFDSSSIDGKDTINTKVNNEKTDSYDIFNSNISKKIVNGAGVESGTVIVNNNKIAIEDSIINSYKKSLTLNESDVNIKNSILNGEVTGKGNNILNLKGNSVLNGDIKFDNGEDELLVSNTTQLNGNLDGGQGEDKLYLGDYSHTFYKYDNNGDGKIDFGDERGLNIRGNINGFENIDIQGQVTLSEKARIKGAENINVDKKSSLNLRINPMEKDEDGRVIGHALYGSNTKIKMSGNIHEYKEYDTTGGALNIITNGLGIGGVIAMSNVDIDGYVRTDSLIHRAALNKNRDIEIKVDQDLDDVLDNDNLYLIYKSIVSSGSDNINAINPTVGNISAKKTEDKSVEELKVLLNDIYSFNPYAYISFATKSSMSLFKNIVLEDSFKVLKKEWLVQGGYVYEDENDSNLDLDTSVGYALAEYGIKDNSSIGIIFGGSKNRGDINNGSSLKGNSIYIGGYGKIHMNNFKFKLGAGYEYTDYNTVRKEADDYQKESYENSTNLDGINAYIGGSYIYDLGENLFLEPNVNLNYTKINQNSIDEGDAILGIKTDSKDLDYLDAEIGIDLFKKINIKQGIGKLKGGIKYSYAIEGADDDALTAKMKGGSNFGVLIPKRDKERVNLEGALEVEEDNGLAYSLGGGYLIRSKVNNYYLKLKMGFKF